MYVRMYSCDVNIRLKMSFPNQYQMHHIVLKFTTSECMTVMLLVWEGPCSNFSRQFRKFILTRENSLFDFVRIL